MRDRAARRTAWQRSVWSTRLALCGLALCLPPAAVGRYNPRPMHTLHGYSDDDLRTRLNAVVTQRPRLGTFTIDLPDDPDSARRADVFVAEARKLLDTPVVERIQQGRRILHVSREALRRLGTLSVAWMRTRDAAFLRRAESELVAVCAFSDWNPSHYLDTAEMSLGVALAYDWLYGAMAPDVRETVAEGLWRLGLQTALEEKQFWTTARNNWGQVCHAGMAAAAIALAERHPDEAFHVVRRAFHNLPLSMDAYAPDGLYPEGPTYWDYGTSFNVAFFILVEKALGTSYGLEKQPGFAESATFMLHATGPTGAFFNFADAGRAKRNSLELPWFSSRFGMTLPVESPEAESFLRHPERFARQRLSPLLLMFGAHTATFAPAAKTLALDWHGRGMSEFAAFRSDWTRDAWYVAVKAGNPSANHGHMDVGGFVLEAHGQRWAEEAGAEDYHALESQGYNLWQGAQDGQRWGVFRYGVESHNIPVVGGGRQKVRTSATMRVEQQGGESPEAIVDLTALYGVPVVRHVVFERRAAVRITDTFEGLTPGVAVRWQMLTQADAIVEGGDLVLRREGKSVRVTADAKAAWKIEEAETLLNPWDSRLPGFRRVSFEVPAPADGRLAWTVRIR